MLSCCTTKKHERRAYVLFVVFCCWTTQHTHGARGAHHSAIAKDGVYPYHAVWRYYAQSVNCHWETTCLSTMGVDRRADILRADLEIPCEMRCRNILLRLSGGLGVEATAAKDEQTSYQQGRAQRDGDDLDQDSANGCISLRKREASTVAKMQHEPQGRGETISTAKSLGGKNADSCEFEGGDSPASSQDRAEEIPAEADFAMLPGEQWSDALHRFLTSVAMSSRSTSTPPSAALRHLNLSNRGLSHLPGLELLAEHVRSVDLTLNRFKRLPPGLAALRNLETLDASRNCLLPTPQALLLTPNPAALSSLPSLRLLDLRFNAKCGAPALQQRLAAAFATTSAAAPDVRLTVWGQFQGLMPSSRDAALLRAQLEPWPTSVLKRRLADDFPEEMEQEAVAEDSLADMERGAVMSCLLACYARRLVVSGGKRTEVCVEGRAVDSRLREPLLQELRKWRAAQVASGTYGRENPRRERLSVSADAYMILRKPTPLGAPDLSALLNNYTANNINTNNKNDNNNSSSNNNDTNKKNNTSTRGGKKAARARAKWEKHRRVWELASACLQSVDAGFADAVSALAVTCGFRGSPHIDKQNRGPFYGLALGDFPAAQGGVCVEINAMEVGVVDTRDRLAQVDGRFPHWVAPYDAAAERFSVIFYRTDGDQYVVPASAVFPASRPGSCCKNLLAA